MSNAYNLSHVTGEDCREWTNKAFGILSNCATGSISTTWRTLDDVVYPLSGGQISAYIQTYNQNLQGTSFNGSGASVIYHDIIKVKNDYKLVGVILDDSALDSSLKVALLADGGIISHSGSNRNIDYANFTQQINTYGQYNYTDADRDMKANPFLTLTTTPSSGETYTRISEAYNGTITQNTADMLDYTPLFQNDINYDLLLGAFANTGEYRGYSLVENPNQVVYNSYQLTTDINNTLIIGCGDSRPDRYFLQNAFNINDPRLYLAGDLYTMSTNIWANLYGFTLSMPVRQYSTQESRQLGIANTELLSCNLSAYNTLPCNIVLTKSYEQAINYLENDVMPSDAILFPFDWENIPKTDGKLPGDGDNDGGDTPGEDGDPTDNLDSTPEIPPTTTAQLLTNNNLYWLQAGQLYSFVNWFWTQAGEIADIDDLFHKIEGLYANLGSAIINIRYMPISPEWIGGVTSTNHIIVGMIEHQQNVEIINKSNPIVREIGSIKIDEKYKSFCDYSPYANISLYLPYHGFIDLDVNLLMGNTLVVRALYDIIAGTIQYFIHCTKNGATFLINTIECKMAVDIPITLQSKSDRDSAIFNNVSNAVGAVIGATSSAVVGNPIGLVMSTTGLSGANAQSAPLSVKGNVGDTGANYASPYCAIYIKRPKYNRPNLYANRVGYPCNKNYSISSLTGFFTVYNPQITFSGDYLPLQDEIDEIYQLLERGVYK